MNISYILASIGVFLAVILVLVIVLLVAKKYLSPSGKVTITVNGSNVIEVEQGDTVMNSLNDNGIHLPSACGGKASCGQCKLQVLRGGGEILDSEKPHFSRKEIKDNWRLGCQVKVKGARLRHEERCSRGMCDDCRRQYHVVGNDDKHRREY